MIRSMTGFGSATWAGEGSTVEVEVRAVNHRHLHLRAHLPAGADAWEPELREVVAQRISRGSVDLRVEVSGATAAGPTLELDEERVEALLAALRRLRTEYALPGRVDLPLLVRAGALLREVSSSAAERLEPGDFDAALQEALDGLLSMRREEGRKLAADLREHLDAIAAGLEDVEVGAPDRLERERERLLGAAVELLERAGGPEAEVDEGRVAQEIAVLADRWDLGEEIARARAHVEAFRELLDAPDDEPVGRRLAFLAQELHRELNTLGAKSNDTEISHRVVAMKNELEGIREQVENVE